MARRRFIATAFNERREHVTGGSLQSPKQPTAVLQYTFEARRAVAARPWTRAERRVVSRGFWGYFFIAVEPAIISLLFTFLSVALLLRKQESAIFVAPIFLCAALAFAAYAIVLLTAPVKALAESYGSIYTVDGYVRYRSKRRYPDEPPTYYVAVLDAEQHELGEWPLRERPAALDRGDIWPAVVEFTPYGGVHRIDGRSTGVLPDEFPTMGIGAAGMYSAGSRKK
jgi:hypothetical protein